MKDLNNRSKILLVAFALLFVYFLYDYGFLSFGGGEEKNGQNQQESSEISSQHAMIDIDKIRLYVSASRVSEVNFNEDWAGDPFFYVDKDTVATAKEEKKEEIPEIIFELVGISWQEGYGFALIGEDILQENDVIEGYTVEKISSDYVILSKGDSTIKLTLND